MLMFSFDEFATIRYVHPSWQPGSAWYFRADYTDLDSTRIAQMVVEVDVQVDDVARQKARRQGKPYTPKSTTDIKMSSARAMITVMSDHWEGPQFVVPVGQEVTDPATGQKRPHRLAGQLLPLTPEWVGKCHPDVLTDIETYLNEQYAIERSPEDEETFPEGAVGADGSPAAELAAGESGPDDGEAGADSDQ